MADKIEEKFERLKQRLTALDSVLVAYSGGVDSTFLLRSAVDVLGNNVVAVTSSSAAMPTAELESCKAFAAELNIRHIMIDTAELEDPVYSANLPDRCYHCKRILFSKFIEVAAQYKLQQVIEGSNADDLNDYRPGMRAIAELGIVSPLKDADLSKADIRILSERYGLSTWDKPAAPCLASRVPYGNKITKTLLARIEKAEDYLHSFGIKELRVRDHGPIARIEVNRPELPLLLTDAVSAQVEIYFKRLGYDYVTLDLRGYRMGSLNETLDKDMIDG